MRNSILVTFDEKGFWLTIKGHPYFLTFDKYPEFKSATPEQIMSVRLSGDEIHWDALDVDLEVRSFDFPDEFPLVYK